MSHLEAALRYASQGLPVFPCAARGKQPAIRGGFHAATTNPATVERYWRQADLNVAIATGAVSNVWVLDTDGAVGAASLSAIEAKYGALPLTRTVLTGSGGWHFWFRYSSPIPSTAGRIAPGIDTRGDSAYIIAPPSVHPNGRRYEFLSDDELATAPEWLEQLARTRPRFSTAEFSAVAFRAQSISERALAHVSGARKATATDVAVEKRVGKDGKNAYGQAALDREIGELAAALPGTRNDRLNCAAFRLFQLVSGAELDGDQVVERLIEASHRNGLIKDDGLRSVLATIQSGARAGLNFPRSRAGAP